MCGVLLGDMIGAPYESDRGDKTKDFEMCNREVQFTDDSVNVCGGIKRPCDPFLVGNELIEEDED